MALPSPWSAHPARWFLRWAEGLRFPVLAAVTTGLFVLDLLVPDALPFVDEILLGLAALLFANLRRRAKNTRARGASAPDQPNS